MMFSTFLCSLATCIYYFGKCWFESSSIFGNQHSWASIFEIEVLFTYFQYKSFSDISVSNILSQNVNNLFIIFMIFLFFCDDLKILGHCQLGGLRSGHCHGRVPQHTSPLGNSWADRPCWGFHGNNTRLMGCQGDGVLLLRLHRTRPHRATELKRC